AAGIAASVTGSAAAADGATADGSGSAEGGSAAVTAAGPPPVLLSVETTPEFLQLPLEYQGFCPWTAVHRRGLLLPGRPELGVVRHDNAYFVFAHRMALEAFMRDPTAVVTALRTRAAQSPELIHLLRMQSDFPEASIARILRGNRSGNGGNSGRNGGVPPAKRDAATETVTHPTERHVDRSYSWNEWTLRRQVLRTANLRKCLTTSQQTEASHFRRDAETQVYQPKPNASQTTASRGTNPPRRVLYFAGLRDRLLDSDGGRGAGAG
ncbi:unnamed protein product, partial [Phaeothamnion confervicola]